MCIQGNGNPIECCAEDATNAPPRYRHPACAPLMIDVNGEDYNRLPSCLNYVRSALNVNTNCSFGPAQQVNADSLHFIIFFFSFIHVQFIIMNDFKLQNN